MGGISHTSYPRYHLRDTVGIAQSGQFHQPVSRFGHGAVIHGGGGTNEGHVYEHAAVIDTLVKGVLLPEKLRDLQV